MNLDGGSIKVVVLGIGPLPIENVNKNLGPGRRSWQFAKGLAEAGCEVLLICCRHVAHGDELDESRFGDAVEYGQKLTVRNLSQPDFERPDILAELIRSFEPACLIGATIYPSYIAARMDLGLGLWADAFGHTMAEAQTKSFVYRDNSYLHTYWQYQRTILDKAHRFSAVSTRQKYALIGELGCRGRLSGETIGQDLVHTIPCAVMPTCEVQSSEKILRGKLVADDDFIVLFSGGYNTWTDTETLFRAIESAMASNDKIRFVSTGGGLKGHDELTYLRFCERVKGSRHASNYKLLGWVPAEHIPLIHREADIAINIDRYSYEGLLGSRNRIVDWMGAHLPLVTTLLCELSGIIGRNGLGFVFKPGDWQGLSDIILQLASGMYDLEDIAEKSYLFAMENYSIGATTKPLVDWVREQGINGPGKPRFISIVDLDESPPKRSRRHILESLKAQYRLKGLRGVLSLCAGKLGDAIKNRRSAR